MSFTPLHDRVLVRRIEAEGKMPAGFSFPTAPGRNPRRGKAIAIGGGAGLVSGDLIAMSVRQGDRTLLGKWSGSEIRTDGEDLIVMHESDVLGVMA